MHCRVRYLLDFDLKIRSGQVCIVKNAQLEIKILKGLFNQYYGNPGLATTILIRIFPPNGLR